MSDCMDLGWVGHSQERKEQDRGPGRAAERRFKRSGRIRGAEGREDIRSGEVGGLLVLLRRQRDRREAARGSGRDRPARFAPGGGRGRPGPHPAAVRAKRAANPPRYRWRAPRRPRIRAGVATLLQHRIARTWFRGRSLLPPSVLMLPEARRWRGDAPPVDKESDLPTRKSLPLARAHSEPARSGELRRAPRKTTARPTRRASPTSGRELRRAGLARCR